MVDSPVTVKKAAPPARSAAPDMWQAFRNEMDHLFDRAGVGLPGFRRFFEIEPLTRFETSFGIAAPPVDVTEDDKSYKITAELPGLSEKEVKITLSGDILTLKGEKREEREEKDKSRYLSERFYGAFQRSFELPDGVDRDKIAAHFSKGVLTLILPKSAEGQQQQKTIEVKVS